MTIHRLNILPVLAFSIVFGCVKEAPQPPPTLALDQIQEGQTIEGFEAQALYTNGDGDAMGARFQHLETGFTLDYLQLQSVPQAFIWVTTYPTSDRGEPHTQEHLLLGKGNKGRSVANLEDVSLVSSTAYTQQWQTCYHFHTAGGPSVFYDVLNAQLDALLYPDYSDLEIEREVHHFGVTTDARNGLLTLEEKGTVYQEMASTTDRPQTRRWRAISQSLYGKGHPLALNSGGLPSAIRTMTPQHIRDFHAKHYQLANMGAIVSLPKEEALDKALSTLDALLNGVSASGTSPGKPSDNPLPALKSEADLPSPNPAPPGEIVFVDYPSAEVDVPGGITFLWSPKKAVNNQERLLLDLFLDNLAGDANSNLYKKLVDTKTQVADTEATSVFAYSLDYQGQPIMMGISGMPAQNITEQTALDVQKYFTDEIQYIQELAPGSPDLLDFNRRMKSRLKATRRSYKKFVNSPPGFGFRGGGGSWIGHLRLLDIDGGFERVVTMDPTIDSIENMLDQEGNPWTDLINEWHILDEKPRVLITRPSPDLLAQQGEERDNRIAEGMEKIIAETGEADPQLALASFEEAYNADSAALDLDAQKVKALPFMNTPPLTLDEPLDFEVGTLSDTNIPYVRSSFPTMSGGLVGLNLSLRSVGAKDWIYLSLLPNLMGNVGVLTDDGPISWGEVVEAQQNEILSQNVGFAANRSTGRLELVVSGSGSTLAETQQAITWMKRVLYHPDWRPENLPRIRDLIDGQLSSFAQITRQPEERWVNNPSQAYQEQNDPLYLATHSWFTQRHHLFRLKWRFLEPNSDADQAIARLSEALTTSNNREGVVTALRVLEDDDDSLTPEGHALQKTLAGDLLSILPDIPDESLTMDLAYLKNCLQSDVTLPPTAALEKLSELHRSILRSDGARAFSIAGPHNFETLETDLSSLVLDLNASGEMETPTDFSTGYIAKRLKDRGAPPNPSYVGFINENSSSGVFLLSGPSVNYETTDDEQLLTYLSSLLYSGGGAHSLFMKTWGAGLAYSNGVSASPASGRIRYYAERSPNLPATLRFVIETLENTPQDPGLAEYVIAQAFGSFRSAQSFESRGSAMAADLADGYSPEVVAAFRNRILALRNMDNLSEELFSRMPKAYGPILPGYGDPISQDANLMIIGPQEQLERFEAYLTKTEGENAKVVPIYPRDFWLVRD